MTPLLLALSTILLVFGVDGVTVSTRFGKVKGFEHADADVFLAIPYARPPVGDLRFEKPEEPEPWTDVYEATQFRNDCTPHYRLVAQFSSHSGEDCLTLNVIRPKNAKNLPVLFWIHGGGYSIGSASQHGYKVFAEKYAPKGVIVVTIQYRLGFMGFFTDGTSNMPGNLGLFDQAAALRFVHTNIEAFGGDPTRVTIWGYSAGGGSVSQLTLSPQTRDLYAHAIIMSGSAYAGWSTGTIVAESSQRLAEAVGCDDMAALKGCMKSKPLGELFDGIEKIGYTSNKGDILMWATVIGDEFLPQHPDELVHTAPNKPTIIGLSDKEGAYFTIANMGRVLCDFGLSEDQVAHVDEQFVKDWIKSMLLYNNRFEKERDEVLEKISDYYVNRNRPEQVKGNGFFIDRYTQIVSDLIFNVPITREIASRVQNGNENVWAYRFAHYNDAIWKKYVPEEAKGSPHVNEYHYLFDMDVLGGVRSWNAADARIQNEMIDMVVTFAKTGKPHLDEWKPIKDGKNVNFLEIETGGASQKEHLFEEPLKFWNSLRDEHHFDIIDPSSLADVLGNEKSNKSEL